MIKRIFILMMVLSVLILTFACANAGGIRVVTTIYPLYIAALNITQGAPGISVTCLAPPAAGCLHDYQMSTEDRRSLSDAQIVIMNGAGLETFLTDLLPGLSATVIEASRGIPLLEDEHGINPHCWVSVSGMMAEVYNITDGLSKADPANTALYRQNADAYLTELSALEAEMQSALVAVQGAKIVTFHEAFQYFADEFGLSVAAVVELEPGSAPSARELADLADIIRKSDVRALFAEPQYDDLSVGVLSRETGVPQFTLDPVVTGGQGVPALDAYLTVMRENLRVLLEALE